MPRPWKCCTPPCPDCPNRNPPPTAPATPARRRYDGRRRSPNCCAATSTVVTAPPKATNAPTCRYSSATKTSPPPVTTTRTTPLPMRHPPRTPLPTRHPPQTPPPAPPLTAPPFVSAHQRRALIARDHGCAFPGCNRPPAWTQAHHIRHWINGGTTDLANLILLCGHHHRVIHHDGWDIHIGNDGHPWFHPPQWMDPLREPRPAQHRQHHTAA